MKIFKKHGLKTIGVFLLFLVVSANLSWGRAFLKTLVILPEFIPNSSIKTVNFLTAKPIIKDVTFYSGTRLVHADLWLPKEKGKFPAAVLDLGVDIDRKDERAQKLANAFARSGIATLVPNIPSLQRRRVLAETKNDLVATFEYLQSHPNVESSKVGFIAFCASGGLILLAAEDTKIAGKVSFVVAINPYFDLFSLYENLTLRQIKDNGQIRPWQPHFKTVEIYNRETIGLLESESERKILTDHLVRIKEDELEGGNFPKILNEDFKKLSKEAQFTYEFLTNKDPTKLSFYKENITEAQKKLNRELSPSANINNLKAKTFILADVNNVYIPYTQAKMLANTLPKNKYSFTQTEILPEGDLATNLALKDYPKEVFKMFKFIYLVLFAIS